MSGDVQERVATPLAEPPGPGPAGLPAPHRLRLPDPEKASLPALAGALLRRAGDSAVLLWREETEAGRGFLWLPVAFGAGIVAYFSLPREPMLPALLLLLVALLAATIATRGRGAGFIVLVAAVAFAGGLFDAKWRTDRVAAPMLAGRIDARLEGVVVAAEKARRGGTRLAITPTAIEGLAAVETPRLVTVVTRAKAQINPGDRISIRAVLMPPPGPVQPGGADFRRMAFYEGRGATGYSLGKPEVIAGPATGGPGFRLATAIAALRAAIAGRIRDVLDGPEGGIAVALITGERGGIPAAAEEALRLSGLAHILSISGLHMALVAGTVFYVLRAGLALVPRLALTQPIRKWAAGAALVVSAGYTLIAGSNVATHRAFVMLAIMLVAVLADRRALSMRNIALAALVVLAFSPESLIGPSFQMSFAATMVLIAGYEALGRRRRLPRVQPSGLAGQALVWSGRYLAGLIVTSLLAGFATTPIAAYHFHRIAIWGLAGNLLAMPLVGALVMPGALVAVLLMPFGLEVVGLAAMKAGLAGVLAAADWVAGLPGAAMMAPAAPPLAAILSGLGLIVLSLLKTRLRYAGLGLVALAAVVPGPFPADLIVSGSGRTAAVRLENGRLGILGARPERFDAEEWLRADGDEARPQGDGSRQTHCASGICRVTAAGRDRGGARHRA
ncbi:MAG: ComEC/Rec2 family competence protein [Hyphomicrobiales bacterium]